MSGVFGPRYAAAYDALYADKDYAGECDLLERIFTDYADGRVQRVLDLGSGTGGHAHELAKRGYTVVGVDRSEPMLEQARRSDTNATFVQGDIASVKLRQTFDTAVLLFAVLGYQVATSQVLATLRNARRHLEYGGLLAFDVWYGPAVLAERPSTRTKTIEHRGERLLRRSSSTLDVRHHTVRVDFELDQPDRAKPLEPLRETHTMRYFFPLELEHYLEDVGFSLVRLGAFPQLECEPDERTWSVLAVARAT